MPGIATRAGILDAAQWPGFLWAGGSFMPAADDTFRVFIENEAGSAIKNTYDETTLRLLGKETVSRPYPYPYGFVLDTRSGDGDSVDCFLVTGRNLRSGEAVECLPVHLLEQIEDGAVDHKILCVPAGAARLIPDQAVADIRGFVLSVFAHVPRKRMQLGTLFGTAEALEFVARCHNRRSSRRR